MASSTAAAPSMPRATPSGVRHNFPPPPPCYGCIGFGQNMRPFLWDDAPLNSTDRRSPCAIGPVALPCAACWEVSMSAPCKRVFKPLPTSIVCWMLFAATGCSRSLWKVAADCSNRSLSATSGTKRGKNAAPSASATACRHPRCLPSLTPKKKRTSAPATDIGEALCYSSIMWTSEHNKTSSQIPRRKSMIVDIRVTTKDVRHKPKSFH